MADTPRPADPLTEEEIASLRSMHTESQWEGGGLSGMCYANHERWPCSVVRLLATLDAARPTDDRDGSRWISDQEAQEYAALKRAARPADPLTEREQRVFTSGEIDQIRAALDKNIADDYHYHPLTVAWLIATLDATRAPRSDDPCPHGFRGLDVCPVCDAPRSDEVTPHESCFTIGCYLNRPTDRYNVGAPRRDDALRAALAKEMGWSEYEIDGFITEYNLATPAAPSTEPMRFDDEGTYLDPKYPSTDDPELAAHAAGWSGARHGGEHNLEEGGSL